MKLLFTVVVVILIFSCTTSPIDREDYENPRTRVMEQDSTSGSIFMIDKGDVADPKRGSGD